MAQYTYDESTIAEPTEEELFDLGYPNPLPLGEESLPPPTEYLNKYSDVEPEEIPPPPPDYKLLPYTAKADRYTNLPTEAGTPGYRGTTYDPETGKPIPSEPYLEGGLKRGEGFAFDPRTGAATVIGKDGKPYRLDQPQEPPVEEMYDLYRSKGGKMDSEEFARWYAEKKPPVSKPEDAERISKYGLPPKGYPAHPFDREKFEQGLLKQPMFKGQNPFQRDTTAEMEKTYQANQEGLFNHLFKGHVTWADRDKMSKEQKNYWEEMSKVYRARVFDASKADKASQIEYWKYAMGEFDAMKKDFDTRMEKTKIWMNKIDPAGREQKVLVPRSDVEAYKREGWSEGAPVGAIQKEPIVEVFSPSLNRSVRLPRSEADAVIAGKRPVIGAENVSDWQMGKEGKVWVFDPKDPDRSKKQVSAEESKRLEDEGWKIGQPTAPKNEPGKLTENQIVHELNNFALENGQDYNKMYSKYREFIEIDGLGREEAYRKTLEAYPKRSTTTSKIVTTTKESGSAAKPTKKGLSSLWR